MGLRPALVLPPGIARPPFRARPLVTGAGGYPRDPHPPGLGDETSVSDLALGAGPGGVPGGPGGTPSTGH